jgi:hypothetical protein
MKINEWAIHAVLILGIVIPGTQSRGQEKDKANAELRQLRERLGSLKAGTSSTEVLKLMGKPDEVRPVPKNELLDGVKYLGDHRGRVGTETERWAYGMTAKGMFPRIGFVSIDRNGKVLFASPTDSFARNGSKPPDQVPADGDDAVATPTKLSCHVGAIKYHPRKGDSSENLETVVTIKNAGTKRFELKHDAANSPRRFLLVEIYDSTGIMLFRFNEMLYHSIIYLNPADWPVLSIDPGKEITTELFTSHADGFGSLPPGRFSLRVYFPFDKWKYYPSNAVSFEIKEEHRKGQK